MEPEILRTARLELSAPRVNDVEAIHAECQDAAIQRFTTVPAPYLPEDAETFVELTRGWWAEGSEATWAIRLEGRLVGMVGLAKLPSGGPEIGYWVSPSVRGRGLATEAARAVGGDDWRDLMQSARDAAHSLVELGEVEVTQKGEVVDVNTARGPVRIRRVG